MQSWFMTYLDLRRIRLATTSFIAVFFLAAFAAARVCRPCWQSIQEHEEYKRDWLVELGHVSDHESQEMVVMDGLRFMKL
jgi:hypothetical protein